MGHVAFMAVFMRVIDLFLMRDEHDEYAPRMLKFIGTFIASFGEEVEPDGGSHPIIQQAFKELLQVCHAGMNCPANAYLYIFRSHRHNGSFAH